MPVDLRYLTEPVAAVLADWREPELPLLKSELRAHPKLEWFAGQPSAHLFPDAREAGCAQSGLLLLLGGWEQCHEAAQNVEGSTGSYWHAIAHRMEPDFPNSGYWFRRVGTHPIFEPLRDSAATIADATADENWSVPEVWDPIVFLRLYEEACKRKGSARHRLAEDIQALEWRLLFEWCAAPSGDLKCP